MTTLVLGASGLLGSNVATLARERGEVVGTYHTATPGLEIPTRQLDLRDLDAVEDLVEEVAPTAVINCAAMTDVDGCESAPDDAHQINAEAPGVVASLCDQRDIDFVHVSTDYVFDGKSETPYAESASPNPIQEYGKSKLEGEQAVRRRTETALILRLSFVYGIHQGTGTLEGFPAWVRDRFQRGEETSLFTDQHVTPTRAGHAASVIVTLLNRGLTGLFHVACTSCVSPYEFGQKIRRRVGSPQGLIVASSMEDLNRPATRPANTCLDVSRLEETLGRPQPTLEEDLNAISEAFGAAE